MKHKKHNLPPEDRVRVKPIRRGKNRLHYAAMLKVLTIVHWDLVVAEGPTVVATAIKQALEFGKEWYRQEPKADASLIDYCEFVVSAAKDEKVINDVEFQLWFSNPKDDARLIEFRRGFLSEKRLHAKKRRGKKG